MMDGGLIEIDPEMFITCRLCVSARGKFQIVPKLQEKIKYVFDIDVRLFDGFSQVMCEKCKGIVTEFCDLKENFQQKQQQMQNKGKITCPDPAESEKDESHKSDNESEISHERKTRKRIRKIRKKVISSSSDEDDVMQLNSPTESMSSEKSIILVEDDAADIERTETKQDSPCFETNRIQPAGVSPQSENDNSDWRDLYKQSYVCRYCNMKSSFKTSMTNHVRTHYRLLKKRRKLTRWHSTVALTKFDSQPNLTGENSVVVLNSKKLVSDSESPDYYILYVLKHKYALTSYDTDNDDKITKKRFTCEDVMSDDGKPKLRKRIRVQSNVSVETEEDPLTDFNSDTLNVNSNDKLELEKQTNTQDSMTLCKEKTRTSFDYDMLKKIISASMDNARKKLEKNNKENKIESEGNELLKRKLLSCGRKIIGKHGYVSMGLLKFLQEKNLKILWKNPDGGAPGKTVGKNSTNPRIHTRLEDKDTNNLHGFMPCVDGEISFGQKETQAEASLRVTPRYNRLAILTKQVENSKLLKTPNSDQVPTFETPISLTPVETAPPLLPVLPDSATLMKTSVLSLTPSSTPVCKNTETGSNLTLLNLLNASPVLNPKKAIKKKNSEPLCAITSLEPLSNPTKTNKKNESEVLICLDSDTEDGSMLYSSLPSKFNATNGVGSLPVRRINSSVPTIRSSVSSSNSLITNTNSSVTTMSSYINFPLITTTTGMCMPVITSTESLALNNSQRKEISADRSISNASFPRIKCKPVSELMAVKTDKSLARIQIVNGETVIDGTVEANSDTQTGNSVNQENCKIKVIPPGFVLLNTVALPNTITDKPFEYLGRLLKLHGLELATSSSGMQFIYLVKFRLGVHQHPLSVMLCLALEVEIRGVSFRIVVNNKHNEEVDPSDMDALWQWEILKAFNAGTVVNKIKQAAIQEPRTNVKNVNLFLSLLGSIQLLNNGQSSHSSV